MIIIDDFFSKFEIIFNSKFISFSFLHVKITRRNKRFVTSILRKATFSECLLIAIGLFLISTKIGLVHTLLFRFFKISSSMENFHIEVELLRSISNATTTLLILLTNVSRSSLTNCMSLNGLYQQYLKRNC